VPTLRHDDVRDELFAGLSDAGRRHYKEFAAVYEARQIASGLAELRTTAKLSQREAAKRAGVDQADLCRIESAQITPSLPTLLRVLDAVGGTLVLARKTAPSSPTPKAPRTPPVSTPSTGRVRSTKQPAIRRTTGTVRKDVSAPLSDNRTTAAAKAKRTV
jgi:transcriptional regulator with XRE-family HTH domain